MKINEALKILGQGQVYYPKLAQKIGIIEAIFLTYLGYWADEDNQLYRKNSEIVEDTAMSIDQLKRVQTKFIKQGWITKTVQGRDRLTYYTVNWNKISADLDENDVVTLNALVENPLMQKGETHQCNSGKSTNVTIDNNINNNKDNNISKIENLDFVPTEYLDTIKLWLNYKKERKQMYASQTSLKVMVNRLIKLSHNNPQTAREIIEESIANNYSGFFELKSYKNENKKATVGFEPTKDAKYDDEDPF